MQYLNNQSKYVVVINKKHSIPTIMNSITHISYGISKEINDLSNILNYENSDLGLSAQISEYPFIILETNNSNQLLKLIQTAKDTDGVKLNFFSTSMLGYSAEDQINATKIATLAELDFVSVILFGTKEIVDPLTKKYSLIKN
ncbi:hypothetical protein D3C81_247200 [compost metagenome]|uniref:DUF2000 domain-containing protein n=1 Tax=Acinetobacter calcoaceticus TaxID=471 RepID=UPI000FC3A1C3|nr:DUF2000 domain-containing protein [Acinetobacter calcoaceticus]